MQFRKIAAVAGSALMTGMTLAGAAIAATNVGNIASLAAPSDSVANFPIFVIGKTAQTSDVAGAVDIAVRMAAESKTTTTVTTTGTGAAVDGVERDGIGTGAAVGGVALSTPITGGAAFPNGAILRTTAYSKLKDSTFSWNGNDYTYREQVDTSGVRMRHDLTTDKINGTEKMEVQSGDVVYEYVFTKTINMSAATTAGTTGTIASPEYTKPIKISMMGKDFTIVGVGATSIKMLAGNTGTATATNAVGYGGYKIYAVQGSTNTLKLEIKDATGNLVDTVIMTGLTSGTATTKSVTSTTPGLDITVTSFGTLTDGTVVGADLVVGPTGTTTHEYDNNADIESTGSSNEAFPGAARWGIQYIPGSGSAGNQQIPANAKIQVIYKPAATEYYIAGEALSLPNDFAKLGFEGWNTNTFATITVKPYGSATGYFQGNSSSISGATLYGLEISSDKAGAIVSTAGNLYSKAYVLFNATRGTSNPVLIGYPDTTGKILTNDTWVTAAAGQVYNEPEYAYGMLRVPAAGVNGDQFNYTFKINAGETDFFLNVMVGNVTAAGIPVIRSVTAGTSASGDIAMGFTNKTVWDKAGLQLSDQFVKLGATSATSEATELNVTTETAVANAGTKSTEIVDDAGILVQNPNSNGGSDAVVFKVPSKALAVKAYFGKIGTAATTGATTTSDKVLAVTTDVVRLDTEVSDTDKTNSNLVLIGGPCVNTLVASLATATGNATAKFPYTCTSWPAENFALVKVVQDAFATGKVAVVVAGTRAQDTDLAALAIQSGKLAGNNATSVKLSGTDLNSLVIV